MNSKTNWYQEAERAEKRARETWDKKDWMLAAELWDLIGYPDRAEKCRQELDNIGMDE